MDKYWFRKIGHCGLHPSDAARGYAQIRNLLEYVYAGADLGVTPGGPRLTLGSSNPCGIYCMYNRKNIKIRLRSTNNASPLQNAT
jgi:hypothetical protein